MTRDSNYYCEKRHDFTAMKSISLLEWRMKERLKTVSVALVLCLNIGIDPPDLTKTNPCAKLECWVDPFSLPPQKALESIGRNLQQQYEVWQPRARYRLSLDPTIEETKKLCCSLRRNAKEERILFHYNGHGVPKPTVGGEIWVFNKNYTQYIPVSIYDIQSWLGSPCIYVYDCSNAGNILLAFNKFSQQRDAEATTVMNQNANKEEVTTPPEASRSSSQVSLTYPTPYIPFKECIQLAACRPNEILPMNPDLPADLFTCCLTTPIEIALRWFISQNPLIKNITNEMITKIPGRLNDRRTPLGELNWIFTAITDTIAWNALPHALFQKLFRQDLMVAALFRNFLLAERIMRYFNCHPMSCPVLPPTHQNPMWQAWDLAVDSCLTQLPGIIESETFDYKYSTFFAEQLTAFEIGLSKVGILKKPPEQLPIVLQVLLSQVHRLRALMLLSRFLDLGPWAVNHALSVGIFPYILKLLQSPAAELKPVLVFIWCKILAVDRTCQGDLLKDNGFTYFIGVLMTENQSSLPSISNLSELRAMCAFILSIFCRGFSSGQSACLKNELLPSLIPHLSDPDPLLRQWICLCLGCFWEGNGEVKKVVYEDGFQEYVTPLLSDPSPEVRASALFAIGTLFGDLEKTDTVVNFENSLALGILNCLNDGSRMVRLELAKALDKFTKQYVPKFVFTATELLEEEKRQSNSTINKTSGKSLAEGNAQTVHKYSDHFVRKGASLSLHACAWKILLCLSVDPCPVVSQFASDIVDKILRMCFPSNQNLHPVSSTLSLNQKEQPSSAFTDVTDPVTRSLQKIDVDPSDTTVEKISKTLRRSASFAFSLFSGSSSHASPVNANPMPRSNSNHSLVDKKTPEKLKNDYGSCSFFDWSCQHFSESQIKVPEWESPGSLRYNQRLWRKERNLSVIDETKSQYTNGSLEQFGDPFCILQNELHAPIQLVFHQYDKSLVTADPFSRICVFDWESQVKLNSFMNPNPYGSRISSLGFINEEDCSLLYAASDEGMIRLYKDYKDPDSYSLVAAWKGVTDFANMIPARGTGVVLDWYQSSGLFFVGGNSKSIRIWDAEREMSIFEALSRSSQSVSCLEVEPTHGQTLLGGFHDGGLKLYDVRMAPKEWLIHSLVGHSKKIIAAKFLNSSTLISGSSDGSIHLWDARYDQPTATFESGMEGDMTGFATHPRAPIYACGNTSQNIQIFNTQGTALNVIKYTEGFLSQRVGTIGLLSFHPRRLMLAACTQTSPVISLYNKKV